MTGHSEMEFMKRRRAVITGIGVVTPVGIGKKAFWDGLISGRQGVQPITRFDASSFAVRVAGQANDFHGEAYMDAREARRLPLFAIFGVAAARMAIEDAGLSVASENRIGACLSSSIGGCGELATEDVPAFHARGQSGVNPFHSTTFSTHSGTSAICQSLGLTGPKASIASGCTSGLDVVEWAVQQISSHMADVLVVGASDAPLFPFTFGMLCATRTVSIANPAPRPFELRHSGSAMSEGAGVVVVEELQHALNRNATIYAEVLGHGSAGDTGDFFRPSEGPVGEMAMSRALRDSGRSLEDIDCICPLAPGVPSIDVADVRSIKALFGDHAYRVPVPGIQSMLGHMVAAASIAQVAAMALAIHHQQVPPTINFEKPDPECDLDCVPNRARYSRLRSVLILARSLNRTCASVVLGAPPQSSP